jgi:probable F420-dependent oxidoreductase
MALLLEDTVRFGVQGIFRRTGSSTAPWIPDLEDAKGLVRLVDDLGFDSMWVGDHVAFPVPIMDSISQLAWAAALSDRMIFGTAIYLLPLRQPAPVAKQIAALDHLCGGRLVFGVGVGGEFPMEFKACGVDVSQRGRLMDESLEVLKKLWSSGTASHSGASLSFSEIELLPKPLQEGGPPVWAGGRSDVALKRAGQVCDGYISYVVTPKMFRDSLDKISRAAEAVNRDVGTFGTGHLLFLRIDNEFEKALDTASAFLSERYGMDFRRAAEKYCALGSPDAIASRMQEYIDAGSRHFVLDFLGPSEDYMEQIERFASDVRPLIRC